MFRRTKFVFLHFGGPFRLTLDTRSVLQWAATSTKTARKLAKEKKNRGSAKSDFIRFWHHYNMSCYDYDEVAMLHLNDIFQPICPCVFCLYIGIQIYNRNIYV